MVHFYHGRKHKVASYAKGSGRDEVRKFLDGLQLVDRTKMLALLHLAADEGPPFDRPDRCRRLVGEEFNEFKTHNRRITWFMLDGVIVLMTAFDKKQPKTPADEIIRGRNAMAAILKEPRNEQHSR